jgi:hypothetical protein
VPRPLRSLQRAGTTNACATDFVRKNKSCGGSIAARPFNRLRAGSCKERKDGAPSAGMVQGKDGPRGPRVDHSKASGQELVSARYWIRAIPLFFGKIDHDDLRVFAQAVEDDLFPVAGDVEGPHDGTVLQTGE